MSSPSGPYRTGGQSLLWAQMFTEEEPSSDDPGVHTHKLAAVGVLGMTLKGFLEAIWVDN